MNFDNLRKKSEEIRLKLAKHSGEPELKEDLENLRKLLAIQEEFEKITSSPPNRDGLSKMLSLLPELLKLSKNL